MEINIQLKALADKINQLKSKIETEESTKHAFVLPFIHVLGYDAFNPLEVVPEFTADLGLKKGEKVDYAIFQNGEPIIIVECKSWKENLTVHNSQLFRYFHVTKTRFALLTNGIQYQFFTDLDDKNKMDQKPFLEFDITNLKENTISEITKFHKTNFNVDNIVSNASALKYIKEIKKQITIELENPSNDFTKLFANKVYAGRLTEKVVDEFKDLVQKSLNQFISEKINDRLNAALTKETIKQQGEQVESIEEESKIVTSEEELEGYRIIVAILRRKIPTSRVVYRDTQSYFGILLDDNNRKPLCRLHLNGSKKYISLFNENKTEAKISIASIDDIYQFEKELLDTVTLYEAE
ncbi:type I restriction enzyme HsdR N-terminal domain-containing protein [Flavobacterium sp. Fl-77]|uniref:Type I restriction enzyme HsdR N-terminal domain-containing protein n=1 Tax=Flavobacterium flavipigmentatum TaxID=2893884 RepID=A0AAJ2SCQ5_9FLAO|nr:MULTISPECIES: type I restriction endonuclease [unclassified Flavobacterium]MDX6183440.1 type I restriction enzyme HsdR N-terminal domain-containing protein [Flavobacterium sp. Fl-33]MDX6186724.1 type I restriction enzyme HsdR N-terminal domain-containing protein [Flavobacterium sp. Fl-77]UFH38508.1 type I restriction enzyme HsdR N-terminal domain-containing protein [Flavobacterium sp. F-70]